jgi:hypothetical protein
LIETAKLLIPSEMAFQLKAISAPSGVTIPTTAALDF